MRTSPADPNKDSSSFPPTTPFRILRRPADAQPSNFFVLQPPEDEQNKAGAQVDIDLLTELIVRMYHDEELQAKIDAHREQQPQSPDLDQSQDLLGTRISEQSNQEAPL